MSDLNYYAVPPDQRRLPHQGGLTAWGVVAIVGGAALLLTGTVSVLLVLALPRLVPAAGTAGPPRLLMIVGMLSNLAIGSGLVWLGIGCCRGRRWTRPILVAGGWVALASGVVSLVPTVAIMSVSLSAGLNAGGGGAVPQGLVLGIMAVTIVVGLGFWVGVPVALIAWFRRESVGQTLAALDPHRRWTDGVPLPVLAWVIVCVWHGGFMALMGLSGVGLWFTAVVHPPATLGLAVAGVAIVAAGYGCYRRSTLAWAASVAVFAVMAASTGTFAAVGDGAEYQRQMTGQSAVQPAAPATTAPTTAASPGGTTVVTTTTTASVFAPSPLTKINPGLGPAMLYTAAVAFGLWVRPRVRRRPTEAPD